MNILQLIASSGFITLNKKLIKIFGLEEAAIVGIFASTHNYNELICEKKGIEFDGWFYKTYEDIEEELGLSKHIASKAIESLIKSKILIDKKKGVPCLRYFKFQEVEISNSLKLKNFTTSSEKNNLQEGKDFNDKQSKSSSTRGESSELQEVESFNRNNNIPKNINKNTCLERQFPKNFKIKKGNEQSELDLFFDSFWKSYRPTCDWNGKYGIQGSKIKAEKLFKDLVLKGESPVYIIWGAQAYLKTIEDNRQNVHAEVFLRNKMWEEFIEAKIKKMEAQQKAQKANENEKEKFKISNDDSFWIEAKEKLISSNKIPDNWKSTIEKLIYFGINAQSYHQIGTTSKFLRDWLKNEYKAVFDDIFGKWVIISKE